MKILFAIIFMNIGFISGIFYLSACIDLGASRVYKRRDDENIQR